MCVGAMAKLNPLSGMGAAKVMSKVASPLSGMGMAKAVLGKKRKGMVPNTAVI